MLKLIKPNSPVELSQEPEVTLLDLSLKGNGLEKVAAHREITSFIETLSPKDGYTYLHINAMTSGEFHGSNRNGDFFPEENLKACYKTFMTSPAHVFRSHINKDPARSYGKVIFAVYNEEMHRVELIAECPNDLVDDINGRISMGDFPTTSMACKTPYDTCSICGNRAKSRQEYCHHLTHELGKLYPDGRKVFAINDGPLHFFDISIVVRPADVNSSVLQKVANEGIIGSAELAEMEGLTERQFSEKRAELKKWSEFIKEISDGHVISSEKTPEDLILKTEDLPLSTIHLIHAFDISEILSAMADLGISPSVEYLTELIARKHLGEGYEGIGGIVAEYIHHITPEEKVSVYRYSEPSDINPVLYSALNPYIISSSLFPEAVEKRASSVGYFGLGPKVEPLPHEEIPPAPVSAVNTFLNNHGKLLTALGVAALLAKYYITRRIESRMSEQRNVTPQNNVKIVLIKKASDYSVAANLSRASLQRSIAPASRDNERERASNLALANKLVKRLLGRTKSSIGRKLSGLLRVTGLGIKVSDNY